MAWTFSVRYSRTFSVFIRLTATVNDTISLGFGLTSALSKNRLVKSKNDVMIIPRLITAKVGLIDKIIPAVMSPTREPSP